MYTAHQWYEFFTPTRPIEISKYQQPICLPLVSVCRLRYQQVVAADNVGMQITAHLCIFKRNIFQHQQKVAVPLALPAVIASNIERHDGTFSSNS